MRDTNQNVWTTMWYYFVTIPIAIIVLSYISYWITQSYYQFP